MEQAKNKTWPKLPLWTIAALAAGTLLLGAVIFSRDYRREQNLLNSLFLQRGEILIHSLEMVGRMRMGERLPESLELFWNNLEESDKVLFIALTDEEGNILALAGERPPEPDIFRLTEAEEAPARAPRRRVERLGDESVYLVYRPLHPMPRPRGMRHNMMWGHRRGPGWEAESPSPRYAWVAFNMAPFEAASRQRMRTGALFALLFCLAALGGVLALFWGHNSRLSRKMYEEIKTELVAKRRLAVLGSLAAGLAHEIRNPLGAIRGLSQHLLRKGTGDAADRKSLEVILQSVDRLNSTVTDFLDYARPAEIKAAPLNLAELLRNLNALAAYDARAQKVALNLEVPERPVMIMGDESRLSQAFLNIYLNAIQAASQAADREGGLKVSLQESGGRAIIKFHDNGPGFSPEQLAQAFIPYFTTKAEGTGLGLAMAEKAVRAHEGADITLASPPSGGGLVTISLCLREGGRHEPEVPETADTDS